MPIVYDNKVSALLKRVGIGESKQLPFQEVTQTDMQRFVEGAPVLPSTGGRFTGGLAGQPVALADPPEPARSGVPELAAGEGDA